MTAYATGHPESYKKYIKSETGIDTTQVLDDDQLASVARAMFKWESGGTKPYSMNDQALTQMLDNVDIKAQINRGRTAYKTQEDPGASSPDPIADIIAANEAVVVPASLNNNTSANDSIGAQMAAMVSSQYADTAPSQPAFSDVIAQAEQMMPLTLDIDTSPETTAQRVAQEKRRLLAEPTPVYRVRY